ncbi:MAG: recombination regulator RecX [Candidatus Nitrotoga sp.]
MPTKKLEITLRNRALQHLSRREYSRAELQAKLLPHATVAEEVDALLNDLTGSGWLSDERALEQIVRVRSARFGTQRVVHELRQKGLSDELINTALPQLKSGELATARSVWQKKFASPPQNQKERSKQIRFLQSRGFSTSVISDVLRGRNDEME